MVYRTIDEPRGDLPQIENRWVSKQPQRSKRYTDNQIEEYDAQRLRRSPGGRPRSARAGNKGQRQLESTRADKQTTGASGRNTRTGENRSF